MWPAIYIYLDLVDVVGLFSQFNNYPGFVDRELVKHASQYVLGTLDLGLKFDRKADRPDDVSWYIESNFVESKTDRKSTCNHVFILARALIIYLSKLQ